MGLRTLWQAMCRIYFSWDTDFELDTTFKNNYPLGGGPCNFALQVQSMVISSVE